MLESRIAQAGGWSITRARPLLISGFRSEKSAVQDTLAHHFIPRAKGDSSSFRGNWRKYPVTNYGR